MIKANEKIRTALRERHMYQWQLAERLGISVDTLTRWMRHELPEDKQEQIVSIIREEDNE